MAKLHSEIRIKSVDGIGPGDEGQGDKFAAGDIIFNSANGEFMKRNTDPYDGANAANSWTVVSSGGGGGSSLSVGDTSVALSDTGTDGEITFSTNGSARWKIDQSGHLIPQTNSSYDLGTAELKVRHLFLSNNSLYLGDEQKISIDETTGKMKFLRRRKDKAPSGVSEDYVTVRNAIAGIPDIDAGSIPPVGGSFADMTLQQWRLYSSVDGKPAFENIYDKDNDLDWTQENLEDSPYFGSFSTSVVKSFSVAVDNKVASVWRGASGESGGNAFYIDGIPHPELRLKAGKYRFYQKHLSNAYDGGGAALGAAAHPLRFYTSEDRSELLETNHAGKVLWWDGDSSNNFGEYEAVFTGLANDPPAHTPSEFQNLGLYVELTVDDTLPAEFWYGCDNHGYMGMKIINEAVSVGGGATTVNDLTDVSTTDVQAGDALIYQAGDNAGFVPKPIAQRDSFVCHRYAQFVAGGNAIHQVHPHLEGKLGGKLIVDTLNMGGNNKLQLKLDELPVNDPYDTMHFEIYSIGTQPFDIEVVNLKADAVGDGDAAKTANSDNDLKLFTDILSYDNTGRDTDSVGFTTSDRFINLRFDDSLNVSVGEGQVFLLHACVDRSDPNSPVVNWYHEIRSGL